jgi:hypothetical protein
MLNKNNVIDDNIENNNIKIEDLNRKFDLKKVVTVTSQILNLDKKRKILNLLIMNQ